ncbi:MAG: type I DNA topoisomerase [Bacteroidota bacterium]
MPKNLVIVESPAKAKTIQSYLGKDYEVASCNGHIRDLPKNNKAIDVAQGFQPTYEVSKGKQQVVTELKKRVRKVDQVYLASDDDREGEAISWHLREALALHEAKTRRIVFREITKHAVLKAIQNPRAIDLALVNSQQARRVLDRLVGYDLSPLLWKKIKPGLSAGRVQSVAVRMIVERERAIIAFEPTAYFVIAALLAVDKDHYLHAELLERLKTEAAAYQFLQQCIGATFAVQALEKKPAKKSPPPPFITSTLQQEASLRLGYTVTRTMLLAQNLYEAGKISYMRTDAVYLAAEAVQGAQREIQAAYGADYFQARTYTTKSATAQEAHEAIRPTDFSQRTVSPDTSEQRLYELIWKRAIASQMADAQLEKTTATVAISTTPQTLVAKGEVVKFEGFLKVYTPHREEGEAQATVLPPLTIGQVLALDHMQARERFTKPPARYTEASLVKQLEEQGIGRPSTYAPIIGTIQQRGYVIKESRDGRERAYQLLTLRNNQIQAEKRTEITGTEKQKLCPTDTALVVNDFLVSHFAEVTDYGFTAKIEQQLDEIAAGDKEWDKMLAAFYQDFCPKVEQTAQLDRTALDTSRLLGTEPTTGKPVIARLGKYGPLVQLGDSDAESPARVASLRKNQRLENITLAEALDLFKLPREVGQWEATPIVANVGRYGPYIKHQDRFYQLGKEDDPLKITLERAIAIMQAKRQADAKRLIKTFDQDPAIQVLNGRWGPYIKVKRKDGYLNARIPPEIDPAQLTLQDCLELAEKVAAKKQPKKKPGR